MDTPHFLHDERHQLLEEQLQTVADLVQRIPPVRRRNLCVSTVLRPTSISNRPRF